MCCILCTGLVRQSPQTDFKQRPVCNISITERCLTLASSVPHSEDFCLWLWVCHLSIDYILDSFSGCSKLHKHQKSLHLALKKCKNCKIEELYITIASFNCEVWLGLIYFNNVAFPVKIKTHSSTNCSPIDYFLTQPQTFVPVKLSSSGQNTKLWPTKVFSYMVSCTVQMMIPKSLQHLTFKSTSVHVYCITCR